jgi:D-alanine-D-alanine ligase
MNKPRVLVLYNEPVLPLGHPDAESEREIVDTTGFVSTILSQRGFKVRQLGIGNDLDQLLTYLQANPPDAIFNLFEGLADRPYTETTVASILEWLGIPFTGCSAETLTLARDKMRTKYLLRGAGLPTPKFFAVDSLPCPKSEIPFPVILKPANHDASVGIEQGSVVSDQKALNERVELVLKRYGGTALVEQFIRGREFHISILDGGPDQDGRCPAHVLPFAEIRFEDTDLWPIYSYDAKWAKESSEYRSTPLISPVLLSHDLMERMGDVARRAYQLLNCRDYARVDLRLTADGQPYILEINPNPFLNSVALINGLATVGLSHTDFICDLAAAALGRRTRRTARIRKSTRTKRSMQEAS